MDDDASEQKLPPIVEFGTGLSQVFRKSVRQTIPFANLKCFMIAIGLVVNYDFDDTDWNELSAALDGTEQAAVHSTELVGSHIAKVQVARMSDNSCEIRVDLPVELVTQGRLLLDVFSLFKVSQ